MLNELELIDKVKNENCNDSLSQLIELHSGLCHTVFTNYHAANHPICDFEEMMDDRYKLIYDSALTYRTDKDKKFSSYVGDNAKYHACNKINKYIKEEFQEIHVEPRESFQIYEENSDKVDFPFKQLDSQFNLKKLAKALEILSNRTRQILFLRYNKELTWREIGENIGLSHEGCRKIHQDGLKKLKRIMKKECVEN